MLMFVQVSSMKPSICVEGRSSHGEQRASGAPCCSSGMLLVSFYSESNVVKCMPHLRIPAANEPRDENAMEDEDADDSQQWRGNVRRRMWKNTCERVALNVCIECHLVWLPRY